MYICVVKYKSFNCNKKHINILVIYCDKRIIVNNHVFLQLNHRLRRPTISQCNLTRHAPIVTFLSYAHVICLCSVNQMSQTHPNIVFMSKVIRFKSVEPNSQPINVKHQPELLRHHAWRMLFHQMRPATLCSLLVKIDRHRFL